MQAIKQFVILGALLAFATAQNFYPHFVQQQQPQQAQVAAVQPPQPAPLFYTQTVQFPHIAAPSAPAPAPAQTNTASGASDQGTGAAAAVAAPAPAQAPAPVAAPLSPSHYVTAFGLDNVFAPFGFAQAPQPQAQVAPATNTAVATNQADNGQDGSGASSSSATHGSHIHQAPASTSHLQPSQYYAFPGYFPFSGPLPIQRAGVVSNAVNGQAAQAQQYVAAPAPAPAAPAPAPVQAAAQPPAPISAYTVSNLPAGFNFPFYG